MRRCPKTWLAGIEVLWGTDGTVESDPSLNGKARSAAA
jgi:hypothetical protein